MAGIPSPLSTEVDFNACIATLERRFRSPLPGWEAQSRMAPAFRGTYKPRAGGRGEAVPSSVLLLLYPHDGRANFVLIERSEGGMHSGQISLPGGKFEASDRTLRQTALRETEEETGVDCSAVRILGSLTELYIPVSGYLVYPHVGVHGEAPAFDPDPREVQRVIEVDLASFLEEGNRGTGRFRTRSGLREAPCYHYGGLQIWGATSMILSEFTALLR